MTHAQSHTLLGTLRLIGAVSLLAAGSAGATDSFPGATRDYLTLDSTPQCTLCHQTNSGGSGTATKPFAISMKEAGLLPFDEDSLKSALDTLDSDKTDSDGDGDTDIDELHAGTDPNAKAGGGGGGGGPKPVEYGFGCASTPREPFGLLAALMCSVFLMRRRRAARWR